MTRDSSPPDAISRSGAAGTPGLAAISNCACSQPLAPAHRERAPLQSPPAPSRVRSGARRPRSKSAGAPALRVALRRAASAACSPSAASSLASTASSATSARRARRGARGSAQHARARPRPCRRACAPGGRSLRGAPRAARADRARLGACRRNGAARLPGQPIRRRAPGPAQRRRERRVMDAGGLQARASRCERTTGAPLLILERLLSARGREPQHSRLRNLSRSIASSSLPAARVDCSIRAARTRAGRARARARPRARADAPAHRAPRAPRTTPARTPRGSRGARDRKRGRGSRAAPQRASACGARAGRRTKAARSRSRAGRRR